MRIDGRFFSFPNSQIWYQYQNLYQVLLSSYTQQEIQQVMDYFQTQVSSWGLHKFHAKNFLKALVLWPLFKYEKITVCV